MRKLLLPIFVFLLLGTVLFLLPKKAAAACSSPLSIDQSSLAPNFNGAITITSSTAPCLGTVEYVVIAYPSGLDVGFPNSVIKTDGHAPFFYARRTDEKTISGNLNLATPDAGARTYIQGKDAPGSWTVLVCQKTTNLRDCKTNLIGTTSFTVGTPTPTLIPTPTPVPSDLPKMYMFPPRCAYQTGESLELTLDQLIPSKAYGWWWYNECSVTNPGACVQNSFDTYRPNGTAAQAIIDGSRTQQIGTRVLCVDLKEAGSRTSNIARGGPGNQNCVLLTFTPTNPTGDSSCSSLTPTPLPPGVTAAPSITPTGPPPPCMPGKLVNGNCTQVNTAIGGITTDPTEFIKTLFAIILGLSGGIALLLIMRSGYDLMFSQGEAEKVQGAKDTITSAIVGLLFIIFSFVILEVIGVDILHIPGFGR